MTEIMLRNIDDVLLDRIERIATRCGWDLSTTLMHLLEKGLHAYEGSGELHFEGGEADVLQAALEALSQVPDDAGFALIGRATVTR